MTCVEWDVKLYTLITYCTRKPRTYWILVTDLRASNRAITIKQTKDHQKIDNTVLNYESYKNTKIT